MKVRHREGRTRAESKRAWAQVVRSAGRLSGMVSRRVNRELERVGVDARREYEAAKRSARNRVARSLRRLARAARDAGWDAGRLFTRAAVRIAVGPRHEAPHSEGVLGRHGAAPPVDMHRP